MAIVHEEIEKNYVCPCEIYSEELDFQIIVLDKKCYFKCSRCFFPWATFLPVPLTTCKSCQNTTYEIEEIKTAYAIICCNFCKGEIPKIAIFRHFQKLIALYEEQDKNVKQVIEIEKCLCKEKHWDYKFIDGQFQQTCVTCGKYLIMTNSEDILSHSMEFLNICDNPCTGISVFVFHEFLITQCTSCLSENVLIKNNLFDKWLSQGKWGEKFSEQEVLSIYDLRIGDHLVYSRKLYDHHVIVVSVNRSQGIFKQIGFTQPKKKDKDDSEKMFEGQIEIMEKKYASISSPLVKINYLPLDCFPVGYVIWRAFSKIRNSNYNLITNNCEHIATWCKYGRSECIQVKKFIGKYAKIGQNVVVNQVVPTVQNYYEKVEKVTKNNETISQIQNVVVEQHENLKGKFKSLFGSVFGESSANQEQDSHTKKKR